MCSRLAGRRASRIAAIAAFVSPDANYLILRHFNIGTEILAFIRNNVPGADEVVQTVALRPR